MDWQWLKRKLSLLEWFVIISIVAVQAALVATPVRSVGSGYRLYLYEGIVRDARTGQPIAGVELSLTMRHRPSDDPSRIISREVTWLDRVDGERDSVPTTGEDGSFGIACHQVFGVWQRGSRSAEGLPVHECVIVASRQGYVTATVSVTPPPEPNDGQFRVTSGILIQLEPMPESPHPSTAHPD